MSIPVLAPTVLFVSPSAYVLSGLASWLDYLLPGLRARGWRAILGLVSGPRFHRADAYIEAHPWDDWTAIQCRTGTDAGRRRALVKTFLRERPDLVVSVNIPDVYPAAASLSEEKPKVAMALHGILPELCADARRHGALIDGVIATNRLACRLVEDEAAVPSERVHYAPCGVVMPAGLPRPVRGERLRIAYVGRLEQDQKRVMDIPNILAKLEAAGVPFDLLVAGDGPQRAAFTEALAPWRERVIMLGVVPPSGLEAQVYSRADCLLLTSRWETGPIVAWEAMAHGVPVVSARYIGSVLEGALKDAETALLFDVGDAEGAARQLASLWRDEGAARHIALRARSLVEERYSVSSSVDAWERGLRSVVDAPPLDKGCPPEPRLAGRLDRVLGSRAAEVLRAVTGRKCPQNDPGGEWPFTHGATPKEAHAFWGRAASTDRETVEQDGGNRPLGGVKCSKD